MSVVLGARAAVVGPALVAGPRARAASGRAALGALALVIVVILAVVIVAEAATRRSVVVPAGFHAGMPGWMQGPFGGLTSSYLTPSALALMLLGSTAAYLIALACAPAIRESWAIGAIVAAHLVFLLGPPLLSADVFGYLDFARMGALHHLNPYTHATGSVKADAVHPYVRWHHLTTPYGPLFTLASYALAHLTVAHAYWALKGIAAASSLGLVALVRRCALRRDRPVVPAILLVGLNPLVLTYAVAGAHNDLLVMAVAMTGVVVILRERPNRGAAILVAAAGIKASAGLLAPFALAAGRPGKAPLVGVLAAVAAVAVVGAIAFGGAAINIVGVIDAQQGMTSSASVPRQLGILFGFGGLTAGFRIVAAAALAAVVATMLVRTHRGGDWLDAAGWSTLALLLATAWLLPWYVVWLLPLAAIARSVRLRFAAAGLTAYIVAVHSVNVLS